MQRLGEHRRHRLLDVLQAERRGEDVLPPGLLLLARVRRVVGDEAVGVPAQHVIPEALDERAVAQRGCAAAVRPEADEIVEVEQQVVRADLHRHALRARLRAGDEFCADRTRDVDDLEANARLLREEDRAVDRLLLDERRPSLVVRERVAPPVRLQPRVVRAHHCVVLRVHEHEAVQARDDLHPREQLRVVDVRVLGFGERHECLEAARALAPLAGDLGQRRPRQRAPEAEVDDCELAHAVALLGERLGGDRERDRQRMLDDRRDPARGRRHRPGRIVLALRVAEILVMDVRVDGAREDVQAVGVDDLVSAGERAVIVRKRDDPLTLDHDVRPEDAVGRGDGAVGDHGPLHAPVSIRRGGRGLSRGHPPRPRRPRRPNAREASG